ncbi:MAG: hypothetical protein ACRD01_10975 [Terriglobales bacterium]
MPPCHATRGLAALAAVAALTLATAGCGTPRSVPLPPSPPLRSATLQQLVASFNQNASAIESLTLKLDLSAKAGKKHYKIGTYLLMQKPANIRIWGSVTLLGKLFDMASNGSHFELSLPYYNQFIEGLNNVIPEHVSNPLEKLRPQVILNALLINPIPASAEVALDPDAPEGSYEVLVLLHADDGRLRLKRRIRISRLDLLPRGQVIYDGDGIHETRATYDKFTTRDNIPVPTVLTIERPAEGYSLKMKLSPAGIAVNQPFATPNPFQLTPPSGSTIIKLSENGEKRSKAAGSER